MFEIRDLTRFFGGLCAVNNFDLNVEQGEFVGLIGPNGAGKSTVFNLITGFVKPTKGKITFEGIDITGKSPHTIARYGIVRTFQANRIFPNYTVLEDVLAASHLADKTGFFGRCFSHCQSALERTVRSGSRFGNTQICWSGRYGS